MEIDHETDIASARLLLSKHLGADVIDIRPLAGGFFSRAFAAICAGREYVVRLNSSVHALESFAKDDYAWRHFASGDLPIPRVVAFGETGGEWYAISERLAGRTLAGFSGAEQLALLPDVFAVFEAIGGVDVSAGSGSGDWDETGSGRYASWRGYLAAVMDNEPEGYYKDWHTLFNTSFLERDVYELVYRGMLRLVEYCPEERSLIHNDMQFGNIVADGERVTGVIDWANALYGDRLYDVARWLWWTGLPGWYNAGEDLIRSRFGSAPYFTERIACYQCHMGLDDLRFCAKNGKRDWYTFHRTRLLALVDTHAPGA